MLIRVLLALLSSSTGTVSVSGYEGVARLDPLV
jgi:hypothetical protein